MWWLGHWLKWAIYFVHANSKILEKPSSDKGAFSLQFHWQNANSEL